MAVFGFEMTRLHSKYEVVRIPYILDVLRLVPPDLDNNRIHHYEHSASVGVGVADKTECLLL